MRSTRNSLLPARRSAGDLGDLTDRSPGRRTLDEAGLEPAASPGKRTLVGLVQRQAQENPRRTPGSEQHLAAAQRSGGQPLPADLGRRLEGALAADLSHIRIHTGAESQAAAESLGARAYALGRDIHFSADSYHPGDRRGQQLIAHEVAHTVQAPSQAPRTSLEVSEPGDASEVEAEQFALEFVQSEADGRSRERTPAPSPDGPTAAERLRSAFGSFAQGLAEVPAGLSQTIAIAAKWLDEQLLPEDRQEYLGMETEDLATYRFGEWIRSLAQDYFPTDPRLQESFVNHMVPNALGNLVGFFGGGVVTAAARGGTRAAVSGTARFSMTAGAGMEGAGQYSEARASGVDEQTARTAYLLGLGIGTTEAVPLARIMQRVDAATGGRASRIVGNAGLSALEEFIQEFVQTTAGNAVAQALYDEDRALFEHAAEAGAAGGTAAAIFSAVLGGATRVRGRRGAPPAAATKQGEVAPAPKAEGALSENAAPAPVPAPPPTPAPQEQKLATPPSEVAAARVRVREALGEKGALWFDSLGTSGETSLNTSQRAALETLDASQPFDPILYHGYVDLIRWGVPKSQVFSLPRLAAVQLWDFHDLFVRYSFVPNRALAPPDSRHLESNTQKQWDAFVELAGQERADQVAAALKPHLVASDWKAITAELMTTDLGRNALLEHKRSTFGRSAFLALRRWRTPDSQQTVDQAIEFYREHYDRARRAYQPPTELKGAEMDPTPPGLTGPRPRTFAELDEAIQKEIYFAGTAQPNPYATDAGYATDRPHRGVVENSGIFVRQTEQGAAILIHESDHQLRGDAGPYLDGTSAEAVASNLFSEMLAHLAHGAWSENHMLSMVHYPAVRGDPPSTLQHEVQRIFDRYQNGREAQFNKNDPSADPVDLVAAKIIEIARAGPGTPMENLQAVLADPRGTGKLGPLDSEGAPRRAAVHERLDLVSQEQLRKLGFTDDQIARGVLELGWDGETVEILTTLIRAGKETALELAMLSAGEIRARS